MNSDFEDPNNHVPEVTPDDGWGDDAAEEKPTLPVSKSLPEKKKRPDQKGTGNAPSFEVREVKPVEGTSGEKGSPSSADEPSSDKFHDPNNHVPRLTQVDDWGDEEAVPVIPKKRAADEKPAGYAAKADDKEEKGVEIGLKVLERAENQEPRGPVQRLEIQEHVSKLTAPESAPLPRVVPKHVIEKKELTPEEEEDAAWSGRNPEGDSNWGRQKTTPIRWMVISGALLAVGLIGGVLLLPYISWKNERSVRTNFSNLEVFEPPMLETEANKVAGLGEGIETKSKALVEAFAKATSVDQVLPLVRDPQRMEKALRERWVPMQIPSNWHIPDESKWEILRTGNREYGFLSGLLPDVTPFRFYVVQEGDKALLDWEASSGYSETTFGDLSKRQGEGGVVRGYVSPGDLYTFSLPESEYQCFRITSADAETSIWGYAKRTEPVAERLAEPFVPGAIPREVRSEYPMTLKLAKAPAESLPNQWIITEMVQLDWLIP